MLIAHDIQAQLQELVSHENDDIVEAEQHDWLMRNMCSDELRSFI